MQAFGPGFASISSLTATNVGKGLFALEVQGQVGLFLATAPYTFSVEMTSQDGAKVVAEAQVDITLLPTALVAPVVLLTTHRTTAGRTYTLKVVILGPNDEVLAHKQVTYIG